MRVEADGNGGITEAPEPVRLLPGAAAADAAVSDESSDDPYGINELRELRSGRHRWE